MNKQFTRVSADKDNEIVIVVSREAAAAVNSELMEVLRQVRFNDHRRALINDMMDAINEALE